MINYSEAMGGFPPSRTTNDDPTLNPTQVEHSWTVYLLPYIEQAGLTKEYYFTDPVTNNPCSWFDQANWPAVRTQLKIFNCPATPRQPRVDTDHNNPQSYVMAACGDYGAVSAIKPFVGAACSQLPTNLDSDDPRLAGGMTYNQITPIVYFTDGASNTILVAEDAGRSDFYITGGQQVQNAQNEKEGGWADPNGAFAIDGSNSIDGSINQTAAEVPGSCAMNCSNNSELYAFHPAGCNVVFADGSVHFLRKTMSVCTLAALTTRAGGEIIAPTDY